MKAWYCIYATFLSRRTLPVSAEPRRWKPIWRWIVTEFLSTSSLLFWKIFAKFNIPFLIGRNLKSGQKISNFWKKNCWQNSVWQIQKSTKLCLKKWTNRNVKSKLKSRNAEIETKTELYAEFTLRKFVVLKKKQNPKKLHLLVTAVWRQCGFYAFLETWF